MSEVLQTYKSRRNQAQLVQTPAGIAVRKRFAQQDSFLNELAVYKMLETSGLPAAKVITASQQTLLLTHLPGQTMLLVLEQQEITGVDLVPWDALTDWLLAFHRAAGLVMTDPNLRNFLWDGETLAGVDFEECAPGAPVQTAARLAAYIRTYDPGNTPAKKQIAAHMLGRFSDALGVDPQDLYRLSDQEELCLLQRRKNKRK